MASLATPTLSRAEMDARITFHTDMKIMEADFSDLRFDTTMDVNVVYDCLEERIAATGETLWFFLVNLNGTRIEPGAWTAYSRRGRALNLAHSMGSVRFDASDATRTQILRAANTEAFDPNLFIDRDAAIARILSLPNKRRDKIVHEPNYTAEEIEARVHFDPETVIMDADFSHFTFHHSRDVDDFYDHLEARIIESDRRWFFLVNLNGCRILPGAWVRYAHRGKRLNEAGSLGSVRFAAGSETEQTIRMRSESQGFRPNIRNTREEALELIEEMRAKLLQSEQP
ncbi:MAG: hypothetical protein AAFY25_14305 [Pseudomonadota bacterium]